MVELYPTLIILESGTLYSPSAWNQYAGIKVLGCPIRAISEPLESSSTLRARFILLIHLKVTQCPILTAFTSPLFILDASSKSNAPLAYPL